MVESQFSKLMVAGSSPVLRLAGVAELVDAPDLGSGAPYGAWGFESPLPHCVYRRRGIW